MSLITELPSETVKLITSTQIVTSVSTAVKELVENSIDAGARVIQVRLENYGLDLIEVKDDGSGVSYDNVQRMFLPGYTSKIRQFEDLDALHSYGFRGEALAAICKIAKVSITTKTNLDTLAMTYEIDSTGLPLSSKPTHLNTGTIVSVSGLFANLPVRRLYLSSKKKLPEELKKTEQVLQSLSLVHPELAVSLIHNKCSIWKKNSVKGLKQSFMQVAGLKIVSKMEYLNKTTDKIHLDFLVPKKNLENTDNLFSNSPLTMYIFVNKRPVSDKSLSQPIQEHIFHHYAHINITYKFGICLLSIEMSPQLTDINLEPNKTKILLKNRLEVVKLIDEVLSNYYNHPDFVCSALKEAIIEEVINEEPEDQPSKKLKLDTESIGDKRSREFREKNKDWKLEIINEDAVTFDLMPSQTSSEFPQSLCSQINSNNSVLTTEEVLQVNTILSETNQKLVTVANSKNSETRLIERDDIQTRVLERPILKEWPSRPKVDVAQNSVAEKEKSPEEIAKELKNDAVQWSVEMSNCMNKDLNKDQKDENNLDEEIGKFDLSMQSISSQMGKKELKAFTKFARIMRPRIIEEFPNIIFTQVAGLLVERWKNLSPDEVKHYEKMAEVVDVNRKSHQEEKKTGIPKPPEKPNKEKKSNLKSVLEKMKQKSKLTRPPRKESPLEISLSVIKKCRTQNCQKPLENEFEILGQLQPSGNWLYKKGKVIGHIRHQGLKELITSQKMLSTFCLSTKSLEKPIMVDEKTLGSVLWNVLISLDMKSGDKCIVDSDVITKNGFVVEVEKMEGVVHSANITAVASALPHFGVSELKDALNMYLTNGECGGLATWRPTSVYNYIVNEAIRSSQESFKPPQRKEIEDMINTYNLCLMHLPPVCLHSKEIFPEIYRLPENVF